MSDTETIEISRRERTTTLMNEMLAEVFREDTRRPEGYVPTIDGVRLAIADADDHIAEARQSWMIYKLTRNWSVSKAEMMAACVACIRIMREIL